MERLIWPLATLSRAVHYQNLSSAAEHIGLSQPQLSRLIKQLEEEAGVTLLERSSRRQSAWTPAAQKLAETYSHLEHRLEMDIAELRPHQTVTSLKVGALEGLIDVTVQACEKLLIRGGVEQLSVEILDLHELDQKFLAGDIDLLLTSKIPARRQFKKQFQLGYQTLSKVESSPGTWVLSPFQWGKLRRSEREVKKPMVVSNSLYFRRLWLEKVGGVGNLPSKVQKRKTKDPSPVILFGREDLPENFWSMTVSIAEELMSQ